MFPGAHDFCRVSPLHKRTFGQGWVAWSTSAISGLQKLIAIAFVVAIGLCNRPYRPIFDVWCGDPKKYQGKKERLGVRSKDRATPSRPVETVDPNDPLTPEEMALLGPDRDLTYRDRLRLDRKKITDPILHLVRDWAWPRVPEEHAVKLVLRIVRGLQDGNLLRDLTTGQVLEDHEIFPALCAGHALELETWTTQGYRIVTGMTSETIPGSLQVHWWIPNPPLY